MSDHDDNETEINDFLSDLDDASTDSTTESSSDSFEDKMKKYNEDIQSDKALSQAIGAGALLVGSGLATILTGSSFVLLGVALTNVAWMLSLSGILGKYLQRINPVGKCLEILGSQVRRFIPGRLGRQKFEMPHKDPMEQFNDISDEEVEEFRKHEARDLFGAGSSSSSDAAEDDVSLSTDEDPAQSKRQEDMSDSLMEALGDMEKASNTKPTFDMHSIFGVDKNDPDLMFGGVSPSSSSDEEEDNDDDETEHSSSASA
jgi:hypothetical protein